MTHLPHPRRRGGGRDNTLIIIALVALLILIGLLSYPAIQVPMDATAANQEGMVIPNTPPPVRIE